MTSTAPGITALSASQAEEFDPEQVGGCPRRWRLHRIDRLPVPESGAAQDDGDAGHALFAMHYRGQPLPKRARMLKAVNGALAAGHLPAREPGQLLESRFDGQPARDANGERLPLRRETTLWLGGVPWDGYVDLRFRRGDTITVLDHKFSSDIHAYAKPADGLLATVQMPVYALDSLRIWPDAQRVELVHHYVSRRGVDSFVRRKLVTVEQVRQRGEQIAKLAREMWKTSLIEDADDVPGNRASCHTWNGCPFQSRCSVFKEKPKMNLDPDELEWLKVLDGGETAARAADEAARIDAGKPQTVPAPEEDPEMGKAPTTGPEADRATAFEMAEAAGAFDDDPFAVFEAPKASTPQEQPAPSCPDCGAKLSAENGSQRDGAWTHIACPAGEPGVPRFMAAKPADGPKCPDCPHPAHPGATCTGKRGRGACRCGVPAASAVEQARCEPGCEKDHVVHTPGGYTARIPLGAEPLIAESAVRRAGHLPTCVQNDAGKWLCMEGCTAALGGGAGVTLTTANPGKPPDVLNAPKSEDEIDDSLQVALTREREMHRRTLGELDASERERNAMKKELEEFPAARPGDVRVVIPPAGWTGTLQVNVNLGPETLALLQRLLGGR